MSSGKGLRSLLQTKQCKSRNGGRRAKSFVHPNSRCLKQLVRKATHNEKIKNIKENRRKRVRALQADSNSPLSNNVASEEECGVDTMSHSLVSADKSNKGLSEESLLSCIPEKASNMQQCSMDYADCDADGDTLL